jgi:pyrroloquinoline quinone (PQQ) biosynthesis protein C
MASVMRKLIGHFRTITKHRHLVMAHCFEAGIPWRGLLHDLSKYSPSEFFPGVKYYSGKRSPTADERKEKGFSKAWMHHKGRNKHHYEYWTDYSLEEKKYVPIKMPLVYVIEMFCDRVAASKVYMKKDYTDDHPLQYFRKRAAEEEMHPETAELLEKLVTMLAEKGEKETFRYIRRDLLGNQKK